MRFYFFLSFLLFSSIVLSTASCAQVEVSSPQAVPVFVDGVVTDPLPTKSLTTIPTSQSPLVVQLPTKTATIKITLTSMRMDKSVLTPTHLDGVFKLEDMSWVLYDFATTDEVKSLLQFHSVTLRFDLAENGASGIAACNRYFAPYQVVDSQLKFGDVSSTMRACKQAEATVESAYLSALKKVASYDVVQDVLTLYDSDGAMLLRFRVDTSTSKGKGP